MEVNSFKILLVIWCHIFSLPYLNVALDVLIKNENPNICGTGGKGLGYVMLHTHGLLYLRTKIGKFLNLNVAFVVVIYFLHSEGIFLNVCL